MSNMRKFLRFVYYLEMHQPYVLKEQNGIFFKCKLIQALTWLSISDGNLRKLQCCMVRRYQCTFLSLRQDRRPCSQIQKRCQGTIIKNVSIQTLLQIFVLYQTEMKTNFRAKYANVYETQRQKLLESLPQEEREQVACELPSIVIQYFFSAFLLSRTSRK